MEQADRHDTLRRNHIDVQPATPQQHDFQTPPRAVLALVLALVSSIRLAIARLSAAPDVRLTAALTRSQAICRVLSYLAVALAISRALPLTLALSLPVALPLTLALSLALAPPRWLSLFFCSLSLALRLALPLPLPLPLHLRLAAALDLRLSAALIRSQAIRTRRIRRIQRARGCEGARGCDGRAAAKRAAAAHGLRQACARG